MLKHSLKIAVVSLSAFFCLSGQFARKDVQEVPSTQCAINEIELQKEEPVKQQQPKRKSAAKKSMEDNGQRTIVRKSAAKRSMERVN